MRSRLARQDGFSLIETVVALVVLNIAILAMFGMFTAGTGSIARASRTSSAAVVAEKQMELYRSLLYSDVGLDATSVASAAGDATHVSETTEWNGGTQVTLASCTTALPECLPLQTSVTGPDGRSYRVDTYVREVTPTGGEPVKRVTVVVRRAGAANPLSRLTSSFHFLTGCLVGSTDPTEDCDKTT